MKSKKIKCMSSLEELNKFRELMQNKKLRDIKERKILLCAGASCIASGALEIKKILEDKIKKNGLRIKIIETGCQGPCAKGPVITVQPEGVFYQNVKPSDVDKIVKKHLKQGKIVEDLIYDSNSTSIADFFKEQNKIVLRNCGKIDPLQIADYIAHDGYQALANVITTWSADKVIQELQTSGLKGRGGAGFPTWLKWDFTRKAKGEKKYVICNADEGDPGAFMDRALLEGDPHAIIEGMAIAAYTVGAHKGYVYVRAEYPLAVKRLSIAIEQANSAGILGEKILGTKFNFDLEIRMGSGAFVCGEETALINSIEGRRGDPRPRPPFPAQKGVWGQPTLLSNVETYANVSYIISKGAKSYTQNGTNQSKGTKVFALAGAVNNPGLVEVPIGTSLGDLVYDIGGGIKDNKNFKAAQMGGPSGGCIPKKHLNVPLDYESLNELGAIMGSGGLIVMNEDACMVDVAKYFLEFVQEESCGKCVPCRVGTKRMLEIVTRICEGKGKVEDIDKLIFLGEQIKTTALCGLGQTAPNPVLSTIRHFRQEYEEHIRDKHCEAGVCAALVKSPCQSACPAKVDVPGFVSLVAEKRYSEALKLHRERNPFASVCARVCFHTCEDKCRRDTLDESVAIRGIKRFMVEQENKPQLPEIIKNKENAKIKIAIVGAGPAGLSCAYFLARLGYKPKIFEAESRPGGMLVQTIPAYRLPREVLAREIRMIENLGVKIETNKELGKDFTLKGLKKQGYKAIFLGIGATECTKLGIPGEETKGVVMAGYFLKEYNIKGSVEVGENVVVIGGGNAAIDAARTALRLGAKKVTIVYRRTQEQMPAYVEEIEEAVHEGVEILDLTNPVEIVKNSKNKVDGVKCVVMELGNFDSSGRRRPIAVKDKDFVVKADQIIVAVGQNIKLNTVINLSGEALNLTEDGFIKVDLANGQTSIPEVFAGGDAVTGPESVVKAIAAGEKAAVGIDRYLTGAKHAFWRKEKEVDTNFDPEAPPTKYARAKVKTIKVNKRKYNFEEVEQSWSEIVSRQQAKRCLRCDYGRKMDKEEVLTNA